MRHLIRTYIILGCLLSMVSWLHAQSNSGTLYNDSLARVPIDAMVKAQYGNDYKAAVEIIDSVLGKKTWEEGEKITDPYGTLHGCVLFSAVRYYGDQDSSVFGIYRDGQIIWHTDPIINGVWHVTFATADINNDGKVEILTTWYQGKPDMFYLWIFSWDGTTARIVNPVDTSSGGAVSSISGNSFELLQLASGNTKLIRSVWSVSEEEKFGSMTYQWDGTTYSEALSQVPLSAFLPATLLSVSAKASVTLADSFYVFHYTWANSSSSDQDLEDIDLTGVDTLSQIIGPGSWFTGAWGDTSIISWASLMYEEERIRPGEAKAGFALSSRGMPAIVRYGVQGARPAAMDSSDDEAITEEQYRQDVFMNSVHGFTIGPKVPPSPFDKLNFLDTINSYINQSRSLGWINSQEKADQYAALVDSAKAQLEREANTSARHTLDTILAHSVADSTGVLSSEAFALIYFNAKYVLAKLP